MNNPFKSLLKSNQPGANNSLPNNVEKKILIVEDDPSLSEALKLKLTSEGYTTEQAINGADGLEKAALFKPNVIILDLMMPVMDGITMLNKLRENEAFKKLPVIVLTNAGTVDNMRDTIRYNDASEFLIKSNSAMEDIVSSVKKFLN